MPEAAHSRSESAVGPMLAPMKVLMTFSLHGVPNFNYAFAAEKQEDWPEGARQGFAAYALTDNPALGENTQVVFKVSKEWG